MKNLFNRIQKYWEKDEQIQISKLLLELSEDYKEFTFDDNL